MWPGADRFFVGSVPDYRRYEKIAKESEETYTGPIIYLAHEFAKNNGLKIFDGGKFPVMLQRLMGQTCLFVSDPQVVLELFTSKSHCFNKDTNGQILFKEWMAEGLIISPASDLYKARRKHASQAFIRKHLVKMQESFKRLASEAFDEWNKLI